MISFALLTLACAVIAMVVYGIYFGVEFTDKEGHQIPQEDVPGFWKFWLGMLSHPKKAMDNSLWTEQADIRHKH
jgi:hypothetical protein